jgi:hypothetical protein
MSLLMFMFMLHTNNKPPFKENLDLVKYILIPQQFIK